MEFTTQILKRLSKNQRIEIILQQQSQLKKLEERLARLEKTVRQVRSHPVAILLNQIEISPCERKAIESLGGKRGTKAKHVSTKLPMKSYSVSLQRTAQTVGLV